MLKITNLYKTFHPGTVNAKTALNGLNLELEEGDFVTVIGGNGSVKSKPLHIGTPEYVITKLPSYMLIDSYFKLPNLNNVISLAPKQASVINSILSIITVSEGLILFSNIFFSSVINKLSVGINCLA